MRAGGPGLDTNPPKLSAGDGGTGSGPAFARPGSGPAFVHDLSLGRLDLQQVALY